MMNTKKIGAVAIAAALALTLGACSNGGTDGSKGSQGNNGHAAEPYIAIISKGFSQQYWQAVKKGAEAEAKKEGARITFEGPPTESDVEIQITELTNALTKNPDAIGFAALDSKAAEPLMQQAKTAGIPVIAFDSGVDSDVPVTTAATDNKAAAAEDAKQLAKLLNGKGTVGLVIHDQTSKSGIDRRDGFVEWMKKNAPGITLLDPQYSKSNIATAAIKDGTLAGSVTQNPVGMGKKVVEAAMKAINGEDLPKTIDTGYYWYDKTNMDDPKIQACHYQ